MTANKKTFILGLTGGIASGKSAAAEYLGSLGATVLDADAISHQLTGPEGGALEAIRTHFGSEIFEANGMLNRRALGAIVFSSPAQRRALEGIIHPMVQRRMLMDIDEARKNGVEVVVLNVPLLFESAMDALCNETWVMALDKDRQVRRVMARDALSREEALARVDSQMPLEEKIARANRVIQTGRPIEQTRQELSQLYRDLRKRIANESKYADD